MLGTNNASDLFRQTYLQGLVIFVYGLVWLIAMFAGYVWLDSLFTSGGGLGTTVTIATLASALAGGLGGATSMLIRLYQSISIHQDFQQQSINRYLLLPVVGLVAGILVLYVIAIPAALLINFAKVGLGLLNDTIASPNLAGLQSLFALISDLFTKALASPTFVAVYILLAWIGGFYQQKGLEQIKALVLPTVEQQQTADLDENSPLYFKASIFHRENMFKWSYTWGSLLFAYAMLWFGGLLIGYMRMGGLLSGLESSGNIVATSLILAAWPVAAAGGMGGVFGILRDLYGHISVKQDFHRQHIMSYLVQPVVGFVLGLVMYLLLASGYLSLDSVFGDGDSPQVVDSASVVMLQLLLGWIAGFRQQTVTDLVQRLIQYLVSLFKLFGRLLIPTNLTNKEKRDALLNKISEQSGFFPNVTTEHEAKPDPRIWPTD